MLQKITNKVKQNLKIVIAKFVNLIKIRSLYLLHALSRRRLKVVFFSLPDPVIIYGNAFVLFWIVKGCYKITINDLIELPGNTSLAYIDSSLVSDTITVQFHGIKSKIKKAAHLNTIHVRLNKSFQSARFEREISAAPILQFHLQKLKLKLQHIPTSTPSFCYSLGLRPSGLHFTTKNLSHQTINLNSYPIKNNPS